MKKLITILSCVFVFLNANAQKKCLTDDVASRVFEAIQQFDSTNINSFQKRLITFHEVEDFINTMDGDEAHKERMRERMNKEFYDNTMKRMFDRLTREIRRAELDLDKIVFEDFLYQLRIRDGVKQLKGDVYFEEGDKHFEVRVMAALVDGDYLILEIEDVEESFELHGYPDDYEWETDELSEAIDVPVVDISDEELERMMNELEVEIEQAVKEAAEYDHEETVEIEEEIFEVCEEEPEFYGGMKAMQKFIIDNIQYPSDAFEQNIQGKVYLSFVVEKSGYITNVEVIRSVHSLLDEEAKRIIYSMPPWSPGQVSGRPVRARVKLPIMFALDSE